MHLHPRPHVPCWPELATTGMLLCFSGCGEPLPNVPLDVANHDRCAMPVPYVVDASASEIQCLVEDYVYISYADEMNTIVEEGMDVPGPPVCCEVCALEDTADDACKEMCKHELCTRAEDEQLVMAWNHEEVRGHVNAREGFLRLPGITASSEDGAALAKVSLHATLVNTQPVTTILESAGAAWNRVSFTAKTFDAESDPITHHWVILGVGAWTGDHIEVELPAGRHVVVLRADDIHRSRGIAARWIDIRPEGT